MADLNPCPFYGCGDVSEAEVDRHSWDNVKDFRGRSKYSQCQAHHMSL